MEKSLIACITGAQSVAYTAGLSACVHRASKKQRETGQETHTVLHPPYHPPTRLQGHGRARASHDSPAAWLKLTRCLSCHHKRHVLITRTLASSSFHLYTYPSVSLGLAHSSHTLTRLHNAGCLACGGALHGHHRRAVAGGRSPTFQARANHSSSTFGHHAVLHIKKGLKNAGLLVDRSSQG